MWTETEREVMSQEINKKAVHASYNHCTTIQQSEKVNSCLTKT